MAPSCPFCNLALPLAELEQHVSLHLEDDEENQIAEDQQLALQIASSESFTDSRNVDSSTANDVSCLVSVQSRGPFYHARGSLVSLLKRCLELELKSLGSKSQHCVTLLSGYVDHYESLASDDGWGCGWRNIQMLCSHLMRERDEARQVLFGGCGFVPDIPYLQRWLEIAWDRGFDAPGSLHFDRKVYGTTKWIGTTECAALLRSFGIRARIVDFGPKESRLLHLSVPGTTYEKPPRTRGPMDRYLVPVDHGENDCEGVSVYQPNSSTAKSNKQQILLDWIWSYFSDGSSTAFGLEATTSRVYPSNKAPLYFQHDGHSRTIVGIQKLQKGVKNKKYTLLILDPAHKTASLESSLVEDTGWQRYIKRGADTLTHSEYQLCFVDPGIAIGEELEQLKTLSSFFIEF